MTFAQAKMLWRIKCFLARLENLFVYKLIEKKGIYNNKDVRLILSLWDTTIKILFKYHFVT